MIDFAQDARMSVADLDRLGDEIAELAAHLHAATYRLLVRLREFDTHEGWRGGFRSCGHWLSWRTGIAPGAAREKVRVAHALAQLPHISAAFERGKLSYTKVRAVTRVARADTDAELLELALTATAAQVERIVRAWRRVQRAEEATLEGARHEARDLVLYVDDDGSYVIRGRLDPEVGALLNRAIEAATEALYPQFDATTAVGQRRADAIGLIAELALANHQLKADPVHERGDGRIDATPETGNSELCDGNTDQVDETVAGRSDNSAPRRRHVLSRADRFQVVVHVDADALRADNAAGHGVIMADTSIPAETSRRIACDASRVVMTHDAAGNTVDVGRRTRTVPASIRRALDHRDRCCRFPGCNNRFCDAHHIQHWADGGVTRLDNLLLLCRRHHRAVHEEGFRVVANETGEFAFYRPNGDPLANAPAAPELPDDPVTTLMNVHMREHLGIDSSTPMSRWAGERLNLDFTIRALCGLDGPSGD